MNEAGDYSLASDGLPGHLTKDQLGAAEARCQNESDVLSLNSYNKCGFLTNTETYERLILGKIQQCSSLSSPEFLTTGHHSSQSFSPFLATGQHNSVSFSPFLTTGGHSVQSW